MNFMRLSLKKAAHASVIGAAYRKSGSFALFAKGGIHGRLIACAGIGERSEGCKGSAADPTLRKKREGWGTRGEALKKISPGNL
jgi:hypothetical protein